MEGKFNTPSFPIINNPGGNATLKTFDDGHMNMDGTTGDTWSASWQGGLSGNYEGTWDWSIQDASQYDATSNSVHLREIRPLLLSQLDHYADSGHIPGVHIGYRREVRADDRISLGFEGSMEYQRLDMEQLTNTSADVYQYSQYYSFRPGDAVPTGAYNGILGGSQIATQPMHQEVTTTSGTNYSRNFFEANMIILRLGMDLQFTLTDRNNLLWGMGVVYAQFKYEYNYSESVEQTTGSGERVYESGGQKGNDGIFGAYFQLGWEFTFTEYFRAYVIARHIHTDAWKIELSPNRAVDLMFRNSYYIDSGISLVW